MSGLVRDAPTHPSAAAATTPTAVREVIGAADGCELVHAARSCAPCGPQLERSTGEADELLFVVGGSGRLIAADGEHQLEPETGALLRRGERYELDNDGPEDLSIVSVALHDPLARDDGGAARDTAVARWRTRPRRRRPPSASSGSSSTPTTAAPSATQFVGYIPVGAAPRTTTSTTR